MTVINGKGRRAANTVNLTTLYNNGNNFPGVFFPESNHNAIVVMSMDEKSSSLYNIQPASNYSDFVKSLFPIMTTGYKHYWDGQTLIDTVKRTSPNDIYTVLELDLPAFVFGYYWYLKNRLAREIPIGLAPHHYVFLVCMHMWTDYNDLTTINLSVDNVAAEVGDAQFAMERYDAHLNDFIQWKRRSMMGTIMKSFTQYTNYQLSMYDAGTLKPFIFENGGKSTYFIQMSWVWTLQSLYWVQGFMELGEFVGFEDTKVSSELRDFFKTPPGYMLEQIKDPLWKKFFSNIYTDVKNKL